MATQHRDPTALICKVLFAVLGVWLLWQGGRVAFAATQMLKVRRLANITEPTSRSNKEDADNSTSEMNERHKALCDSTMFGKKPEKKETSNNSKKSNSPIKFTGVLGAKAFLNGEAVAPGGMVSGSKLVEIHSHHVVLEKDGERSEIALFLKMDSANPTPSRSSSPAPTKPAPPSRGPERPTSAIAVAPVQAPPPPPSAPHPNRSHGGDAEQAAMAELAKMGLTMEDVMVMSEDQQEALKVQVEGAIGMEL